tara:strand:- start:30312 stop:31406 length:1095 start_codon:yes stop_codon:yes gene_type:complete
MTSEYFIKQRPGVNKTWYVYFKYLGRRYQRTTKCTDYDQALERAKAIYDEVTLSGNPDIFVADEIKPKRVRNKPVIGGAMTWDQMEENVKIRKGRYWTDARRTRRHQLWRKIALEFWGKPYYDIKSCDINQESIDRLYDYLMSKYSARYTQSMLIEVGMTCKCNGMGNIWIPRPKIQPTPFVAPPPGVMQNIWDSRHELEMDQFRMLMLALGSGLRRKEICYAKWEWINVHTAQITVTPSKKFQTKNGLGRTVPFFDQPLQELLDSRYETEEDSDYILGIPYSPSSFYQRTGMYLGKWLREKGFNTAQNAPIHGLRKYFGSVVVSKTGSIYKAQKALGHSSFATTESTYTDLIAAERDDYSKVF